MPLEIHTTKETPMEKYIVEERLALTEDGERLVPEESEEARWLYAIPGQEIPLADAERFGLTKQAKKKNDAGGDEPKTLIEQIDAVSSHAQANDLATELGLSFDDKKPPLAEKKAALHEAAAKANDDD
jgi:hypothetical protein